tara:strand:+ start:1475 stop:1636 length:162 start_codon:yes stop_codon:yes gene_type:complete
MYNLQLTGKEVSLLAEIFASLADLDLSEHYDEEGDFDALWDKIALVDETVPIE